MTQSFRVGYGAPAAVTAPQSLPLTWMNADPYSSAHADTARGKRGALEHTLELAACDVSPPNKRSCSGDNLTARHLNVVPLMVERAFGHAPDDRVRNSNYYGVRWSSKKKKWRVRIKANGKVISFPYFLGRALKSPCVASGEANCC